MTNTRLFRITESVVQVSSWLTREDVGRYAVVLPDWTFRVLQSRELHAARLEVLTCNQANEEVR